MSEREQLNSLARPIPRAFVHQKPGSNAAYISHAVITQKLLAQTDRYSFEITEVLYGYVPEKKGDRPKPAIERACVGCLARMEAEIDGHVYVITEAGDVEHPHNDSTDGARLKKAASDAFKRCGMRLGAGLQLWNLRFNEYILPDLLAGDEDAETQVEEADPDEELVAPEEAAAQWDRPDEPVRSTQAEETMSIPEDAEQATDPEPSADDAMAPAKFIGELRDRSAALPRADKDVLRAWLDGEGMLTDDGRLPHECTNAQAIAWADELMSVEGDE